MTFPLIAAALGLAEFVPRIAQWLTGRKNHTIADKIMEIAKSVTGISDFKECIDNLKEDPKHIASFQKAILERQADFEKMYMEDRKSARERDIALLHLGRRNTRADIMVISAVVGLAMCLLSLGFYASDLPGEAVGIISTIAGIFGACLKDAYTFEFGSSRESKLKDTTIQRLAEHKTPDFLT